MKSIFGGRISYVDLKAKKFMDALIESYDKKKPTIALKTIDGKYISFNRFNKNTGKKETTNKISTPEELKLVLTQYLKSNPTISDKESRLIIHNVNNLIRGKDIPLNENISQTFVNSLNKILQKVGLTASGIGGSLGTSTTTNTIPPQDLQSIKDEIEQAEYIYISPKLLNTLTKVNITKYPSIFSDLKKTNDIFYKNIDKRCIFKFVGLSEEGQKIKIDLKPLFMRYNAKSTTLGASSKFNAKHSIMQIEVIFNDLNALQEVWKKDTPNGTFRPITNDFVKSVIKELFSGNVNAAETALWVSMWFKDPNLKPLYNRDKTVQNLVGRMDKTIDSFNTNIGRTIDSMLQRKNQKEKTLALVFTSPTDFNNFIEVKDKSGEYVFQVGNDRSRSGVYFKKGNSQNPYMTINSPLIKQENAYFIFYVEGNSISLPEVQSGNKKIDHIIVNGDKLTFGDSNNPVDISFNKIPQIVK